MRSTGKAGLALLGAAACMITPLAQAIAQPPPGGGGPGGPFGGRRMGGMMGMRGGFGGGLMLLRNKSVQTELKMTQPQIDKLDTAEQALRETMRGMWQPGQGGGPGGDPQAFEQMRTKMQAAQDKAVADVLDTTQAARFKQIQLQQMGPRAFGRPDVAGKLQITAAQKTQLQSIQQAQGQQMRTAMQGFDFQNATPEDRQKAFAKFQEMQKATGDKMMAVLTPAQKAQWTKMVGKPFAIVREPMGPGMRGGGGRRRGNGGPPPPG